MTDAYITFAKYTTEEFYDFMPDRQITIHLDDTLVDLGFGGFEGARLSKEGRQRFLEVKSLAESPLAVETATVIKGCLDRERTGLKIFKDGTGALCTWNNLRVVGTIERSEDKPVPSPIKTSVVVFYEYDKDAQKGWVYTCSGKTYYFHK